MTELPEPPKHESKERRRSRRFIVPSMIASVAALGTGLIFGHGGGDQEHKPATPAAAAPSHEATPENPNKFPETLSKGDKVKCFDGILLYDNPNPESMDSETNGNTLTVYDPVVAKKNGQEEVWASTLIDTPGIVPVDDMPLNMAAINSENAKLIARDPAHPLKDCTYTDRQQISTGDADNDPAYTEPMYVPATSPITQPIELNAGLMQNKGVFAVQLKGNGSNFSEPGESQWVKDLGFDATKTVTVAQIGEGLPETS